MPTGHLEWGTGDRPDLDQYVDGTYPTRCLDYSYLDGPKGQFRGRHAYCWSRAWAMTSSWWRRTWRRPDRRDYVGQPVLGEQLTDEVARAASRRWFAS